MGREIGKSGGAYGRDREDIRGNGGKDLLAQRDGMYRRIYDIQTRIDEELENEIASVN